MKRLFISLILFLLLVLEGVALKLLPTKLLTSDLIIIPHWTLVFLILVAIFFDKENTVFALLYSIIFGLLIDIVYTDILGVYMFSYSIAIYVVHLFKKLFHINFTFTIIVAIFSLAIADSFIHAIYLTVDLTNVLWIDYLIYRLVPTVIANLLFLLLLYPIAKNLLSYWHEEVFIDK